MVDTANLSYSAQHIDELLRCAICLDRYRTPKLLPCQHTFCESPCLEQLVDRFHRIKCPECREEHRVPYAGVTAFPTNRTILNFLDVPAQRSPQPQRAQTSNRETKTPERAGLNNEPANENQNQCQNEASSASCSANVPAINVEPSRGGCSACGRQLSLSRCSHCDNILCDTCKRSHMDQLRLDINRLVSQLRRGLPNFSDAVSTIESKSEQLHQRAEAGKAEITDMIERYISELRNRQRLLHSEVQMWLLGEIRSLRMLQENIEVELASTASFCDSTESTLSRANTTIPDDDLVDMKRQCVEHMEVIRAYENGNGVRLPRERRVEVAFEGSRFSQAISNFGELTIIERENGTDSSSISSDPPLVTSLSSSSREESPATGSLGVGGRDGGTDPSPGRQIGAVGGTGRGTSPPSLETALLAIGSSVGPAGRRGERMAGLMGASHDSTPSPRPSPRPRDRIAGLLTGGGDTDLNQTHPPTRERAAGMFGAGASSGESDSSSNNTPAAQRRHPVQPALSWELPVDFSYPPRSSIRAGNGNRHRTNSGGEDTPSNSNRSNSNHGNPRRSMQERRRHNLTDSHLLPNAGRGATRSGGSYSRNRGGNNRHSISDPMPGPSTEPDPPGLMRSRTYTREEFQTIREEDNVSRASTADPINRPREPIRFDSSSGDDDLTYRVGNIDGGESTRVNMPRNNYQDKGRAIIRFGTRGSNDSEFIWPRGIAVSRADQIYVADSSNHRVQVFDNIGGYVKHFGSYGQDHGEFDCLAGVSMNTMGDILITDRYNHRVQVFDCHGSFKLEFGEEGAGDGQLSYPWGIASDNMGFIYVCDKENHRIQVFQSNGIFARKFGSLGRNLGQFENPHYLAISPDNKIYVSDSGNHRIQVFSMYGDFLFQFGGIGTMQGQMKHPKGISVDDQGFVVVADSGNNRIQVFRGDGRFYCMFGSYGSDNGQFKGLEGLAILGNGNVAVSDRENHRIQIF